MVRLGLPSSGGRPFPLTFFFLLCPPPMFASRGVDGICVRLRTPPLRSSSVFGPPQVLTVPRRPLDRFSVRLASPSGPTGLPCLFPRCCEGFLHPAVPFVFPPPPSEHPSYHAHARAYPPFGGAAAWNVSCCFSFSSPTIPDSGHWRRRNDWPPPTTFRPSKKTCRSGLPLLGAFPPPLPTTACRLGRRRRPLDCHFFRLRFQATIYFVALPSTFASFGTAGSLPVLPL